MSPNSPNSAVPAASARPSTRRLLGLFALGTVLGVFLHYLLYRFSLPIEPFIYVAF
jgi:type VI protein secretion system component VasF